MARQAHHFHGIPGILATWPSNPEIIGVFPELSATVIPHAQEIRLRRGDALDIEVQVQDDLDPPNGFGLSGAVMRWAAKQGFGETERRGVVVTNDAASIIKRSHDPSEIDFTRDTNGQAIIHLRREDTLELPLSPSIWDLEVTKAVEEITVPPGSTIRLVTGSAVVFANNFSWKDLMVMSGDIFFAQGKRVLVLKRLSELTIEVDHSAWTNEAAIPAEAPGCDPEFCLFRGLTKTVASGPFTVEGDVVL